MDPNHAIHTLISVHRRERRWMPWAIFAIAAAFSGCEFLWTGEFGTSELFRNAAIAMALHLEVQAKGCLDMVETMGVILLEDAEDAE